MAFRNVEQKAGQQMSQDIREKQKSASFINLSNIKHFLFNSAFSVSVLSIVASLLLLAVLSLLYGANPANVIYTLFYGAFRGQRTIMSTLVQMTPLILCALAVHIPYKVGFFNVGGQGQLEMAALVAVFVGTNLSISGPLAIIIMLLVSMIVGVVVVTIPLVLKIKRGANEVTTTIMMTFVCVNFLNAMVTSTLKDPDVFFGATRALPSEYMLPGIPLGSGFHIGIWLTVIIAVAIGWVMKNTTIGYKIRAVGNNKEAARVAGINVQVISVVAVLAGGALAGLAGGFMVTGVTGRVAMDWSLTWGFTGLSIAFLGATPIGIIPVALLMAILETGARYMQAMTSIPSSMISIIQGIPVVIFVSLTSYRKLRSLRHKTKLEKQRDHQ